MGGYEMKKAIKIGLIFIAIVIIIVIALLLIINNSKKVKITKLDNMISGTWQAQVVFPDWKGYIDDTLALNSMYSFDMFEDQGKLYFNISKEV